MMKISGLQKVTLLDYPGKLACTIFTCGCNFRCPFCHNEDLVWHPNEVPEIKRETIFEYLEERKNFLEGVCITGGEPLINKEEEIVSFLCQIKNLGLLIKLDTNGTNPNLLEKLINDKLIDMVAMDIKTSLEKYHILAGLGIDSFGKRALNLGNEEIINITDSIVKSINIILSENVEYEFRTTVIKPLHEVDDFEKIGKLISGAKNYFIQSYRRPNEELVDADVFSAYTKEELECFANIARKFIKNVVVRGI